MPKTNEVHISSESNEQKTVILWAKTMMFKYPDLDLLYHVPNEGKRSRYTGIKMIQEGLRKGVPDLCLPVPKHGYHGLYIEMKYGKNKTTAEQKYFIEKLSMNGYVSQVCYSSDEAIKLLEWYLS